MKNIKEITGFTTEFNDDHIEVIKHLIGILKKSFKKSLPKIMFTEDQWLIIENSFESNLGSPKIKKQFPEEDLGYIYGAKIISTHSDKFYIFVEKD